MRLCWIGKASCSVVIHEPSCATRKNRSLPVVFIFEKKKRSFSAVFFFFFIIVVASFFLSCFHLPVISFSSSSALSLTFLFVLDESS